MSKLSFKTILLLSSSILLVLAVATSNYISYQSSKELHVNSIYTSMKNSIQQEVEVLRGQLGTKIAGVNDLAEVYANDTLVPNDVDRALVAAKALNLDTVIIGYKNKIAFGSDWEDGVSPENFDPTKRPWFIETIDSENIIVSDAYSDFTTGNTVISITKSFGRGVVLADIELGILDTAIERATGKDMVAVMFEENGNLLSSTSPAVKEGTKLQSYTGLNMLYNHALEELNEEIHYTLNGAEKIAFSLPIKIGNKKWYILVSISEADLLKEVNETRNEAILITLVLIAVSMLTMFAVLYYVYKPILLLKETVTNLASGDADLTQRLEVTTKDDLGQIANGINIFISNIQKIMLEVQAVTGHLNTNVNDLKKQSNINTSILKSHVVETEQVVAAIEEMNVTAETVAKSAAEASQHVLVANQMGQESRDVTKIAQKTVSDLVDRMNTNMTRVESISEQAANISEVTSVIGGIAEQTNLLALNAAIEAARAGEQGRGFAVVADEVRNLASRTQGSTQEIEGVVNGLSESSQAIVTTMSSTRDVCVQTAEQAGKVSNDLVSLVNVVTEVNDLSAQIATAAEEQSSVSQEISRNMSSISDIVKELENIDEETAVKTENIASVNTQLISIVSRFKL